MCRAESRCAAIAAAVRVLLSFSLSARGDEPVKPTAPASEANPAVPAAGHSVHGEAFNDGPRHAAYLMPGMGKVHFPVTSKKPEVQAFIDQGVAQLHSFYYFESERSFRQAAKIDPDCAMAYWGMAMSNINNAKRAPGVSQGSPQAGRRRSAVTSRFTSTRWSRFSRRAPTPRPSGRTGCRASRRSSRSFPGDIDARAWLAMVTWQNSMDGIGSRQAVDTLLDTVLQVEPMHPGAHHYRIHLWDGVKADSRREIGRALRQDRARDRPRLAHAGPHLHRAEAVCRRRLSAGRLGPRRPRLHDPRPGDAVRDSQLRAQQPVALHEPQPYRPRARRHRRGAQPGRAAARPAEERAQRRRLAAAERPRPLGGDLDPLRALGRA